MKTSAKSSEARLKMFFGGTKTVQLQAVCYKVLSITDTEMPKL